MAMPMFARNAAAIALEPPWSPAPSGLIADRLSAGALANQRQDRVLIRVPTGGLLGEHEIAIDRHLERASARGHERDLGNARLELLQEPLRQTDGSRGVASARAVLDGEFHDRAVYR
jgi:hypothetical protein